MVNKGQKSTENKQFLRYHGIGIGKEENGNWQQTITD